MEYTNKKQVENLLRLKSFHNLKKQVSLHASLNTCKGVVRCPDLKGVSEEELLEEMREQGVIHVRRIKVRRDDALKDTNTFVFTFKTSVLPKLLKVAFLRVSVDPYKPNPLRCYAIKYLGIMRINAIGKRYVPTVVSLNILLMKRIVNAQQNVLTAMKTTQQTRSNEKEILKVKYTRNISFPKARKIVESYTAAPSKSYASITKSAGVTVSCVDAATQTDPVLITAAPQSSSYNAALTEASASTQKDVGNVKPERKTKTRQS